MLVYPNNANGSSLNGNRKNGFALILSLGILALLVSLMLSMSLLVSVETRSQSTVNQISVARANALLGLKVAIGEVQKDLGPDTVITADASLTSTAVTGKNRWLGVWNSDGTGTPIWMVSGDETPQTPLDAANSVDILGDGESYAPKVRIGGNSPSGYYAFWVSDLAQKARIDLTDERITENGYISEDGSTIVAPRGFGVSSISDLSELAVASEPSQEGDKMRAQLGSMPSLAEAALLTSKQDLVDHYHGLSAYSYGLLTNVIDGGLKQDLTTLVTATSAPPGTIYPDGPPWALLENFLALSKDIDGNGIRPSVRNPVTSGGATVMDFPDSHGVAPVVFFWELGMSVALKPPVPVVYEPTDIIPLELRLEPVVVMLNPYDVPLKSQTYTFRIESGGGSYTVDEFDPTKNNTQREPAMVLELEGASGDTTILTPHSGSSYGKENYGNYLNEWLPDFTGHTTDSSGNTFRTNSFRVSFTASFEPGEIKVFALSDNTDLPGKSDQWVLPLDEVKDPLSSHYASSEDISGALDQPLTGEMYDQMKDGTHALRLRLLAGSVKTLLYLGLVDNENPMRSHTLTTTQSVAYDAESSGSTYYIGAYLKGPNDLVNKDDHPASHEGLASLRDYNLRSNYQQKLYKSNLGITEFGQSPVLSPFSDTDTQYKGVFSLWDPAMFDSTSLEPRLVFFHLPREPMSSLAELQQVDFSTSVYAPTYAVGNSRANPWIPANATAVPDYGLQDFSYLLNQALWDDYFFSTLETDENGVATPAYPRIQIVDRDGTPPATATLLDPERAAGYLMIDGPFNVNSDSVDAWTALLASGYRFPTRIEDAISGQQSLTMNTGSAYARSPLPAGDAIGEDDDADTTAEYWRGYRDLSDVQIRNLAGQIVHQIRQRGPFTSLAEFINRDPASGVPGNQLSGLLQAAIDSQQTVTVDGVDYAPAGINPTPDATNAVQAVHEELDYAFADAALGLRSSQAPGYLSQADLLAKLGPLLTVRGDSFLIRAYGESVDPLTGNTIASAQCEAIVQRMPSYLEDPAQDPAEPANAANTPLGRKFRIVAFRWLNGDTL